MDGNRDMSEIQKSVSVSIPTKQATERDIRVIMKRGKGTIYVNADNPLALPSDSMKYIPHGVFYADGEERMIADGGNFTLIKFRRTGDHPDDGEWLTFATSTGVITWP